MTALIIIGALLLLFFLLLMLRLRLRITAEPEVKMDASVLFFRFRLYPKKVKQPNPRRFSAAGLRRKLEKERKKRMNAEKKEAKKAKAKAEKKEARKKAAADGAAPEKRSLTDTLSLVRSLAESVFSRLSRYLRLDVARLHITVSTDDAAKTGLVYGAVCASVSWLLAFLDRFTDLRRKPQREATVDADFVTGKSRCELDICASLRVWQLLAILIAAAYRALKKLYFSNERKG